MCRSTVYTPLLLGFLCDDDDAITYCLFSRYQNTDITTQQIAHDFTGGNATEQVMVHQMDTVAAATFHSTSTKTQASHHIIRTSRSCTGNNISFDVHAYSSVHVGQTEPKTFLSPKYSV